MKRILIFLFFTILSVPHSFADSVNPSITLKARAANTQVELIPETLTISAGQKMAVALKMTMDEGWHTYWKDPGDSGYPTTIRWDLPQGFKASDIIWPDPIRIEMPPLVSYGYEGQVVLLSYIDVPMDFHEQEVSIKANVTWLACEKQCVPGVADFVLNLRLGQPVKNPAFNNHFKKDYVKTPPLKTKGLSLGLAIIFAFLGGIILNLMPCVFPVLSIKILNLVQYAHANPRVIRLEGILFTLGIVISFWILAGLMIFLKTIGQTVGWGFQFQSPIFVLAMAILFLILALNMFGLFEIGTGIAQWAGTLSARAGGWQHPIFYGFLTTLVATPCTAPFMGSALGFAVVQPPVVILVIFTFLGLGMALPYCLLSFSPKLLRFIPKPGPWMANLKKFFGILFLATSLWLIWVFTVQRGYLTTTAQSQMQKFHWKEYSPALVDQLRKENQPIFIDFTAAWCLSCQVNKKIVFNNKEVIEEFLRQGIVLVKADWTNSDPKITQALQSFGRSGVPLYVYYPEDGSDPVILPEVITPAIVLKVIKSD